MFCFNRERVNWNQPIGEGFYGTIYPYQKHSEDRKWIVKRVVAKDSKDLLMYFQEITIALSCDSPYVLPIRGYHVERLEETGEWEIFMRMPRMKTSLNWIVDEHRQNNMYIPEDMIVQYFYAITKGIAHMHERGLAHRDMKPENVLISEDHQIKVTDLGLSSFYDGDTSAVAEILGDPIYAAPENYEGNTQLKVKDLFHTDLWSLGVTMVELCTQIEANKLYMGSSTEGFEEGIRQLKMLEGVTYSKSLINLILSLLKHQPDERISLGEILYELEMSYGSVLEINNCQNETIRKLEKRLRKIGEKKVHNKYAKIEAVAFDCDFDKENHDLINKYTQVKILMDKSNNREARIIKELLVTKSCSEKLGNSLILELEMREQSRGTS